MNRMSRPRFRGTRRGAVDLPYDSSDVLTHLTNFMCSELLAARFFLGLSRRTREPVLKTLLSHMARDEFRHCAGAGDLLRKRVEEDATAVGPILARPRASGTTAATSSKSRWRSRTTSTRSWR